MMGAGIGRVVKWGRKAVRLYAHWRTGKGYLGEWRERIGRPEVGCRGCGRLVETGLHLAFECPRWEKIRPANCASWEDFDMRENWRYEVEVANGVVVRDRVEDFLTAAGWGVDSIG